jgi:GMP synthase (glutamine-hydrolysing)
MHDKILILDFGSQVTQLIARRVREAHVYCEIHPNDVSDDFIRSFAPKGIILSGSHASTYEDHQLRAPQAVWDLGVPVLGICYGMQTMAVQLGGKVELERHPRVRLRRGARPWPHPPAEGIAGLRHGRRPRHAQGLDEPRRQGHRAAAGLQADGLHAQLPHRRHGRRGKGYYAVQFHPEVTHTVQGAAMLTRFVREIAAARATGSWATTSRRRWPRSASRWATRR